MALVDSEAAFEQRLREVIPIAAVRGSVVTSQRWHTHLQWARICFRDSTKPSDR